MNCAFLEPVHSLLQKTSRISIHERVGVNRGLNLSKKFHFELNVQKKVPNNRPELYQTKEKMLQTVIWHLFLEFWAKVKNFLTCHLRFFRVWTWKKYRVEYTQIFVQVCHLKSFQGADEMADWSTLSKALSDGDQKCPSIK